MGISGLLPVLRSITEPKTLDEYRGKTLAIDGYCWLHRAIYSCSEEICLGQATDKYITYFMERVTALIQHGITPYVVFDGGPLPMKKGTEDERREARQKNRELGMQYHSNGNLAEARKCFVRAADVSPFMAHRVIQALKARKVQYVVAPYEADAQLAFLMKQGLADGVITEDSDCLPFGCHTVLFKMDRDGVAQEIQTQNLKKNKGLIFHMFTDRMFLEMCILSGCDYLPSIPGFGLKKAYLAIKQHGNYTKTIRALRLEGKVRIPPTYEDDFKRAVLTFHHQRVYDPRSQKLVFLTPAAPELIAAGTDFLGPELSDDVAKLIAEGDLDPITMVKFAATNPSEVYRSSTGISSMLQRPETASAVSKSGAYAFERFAASSQGTRSTPAGASLGTKRKFPISLTGGSAPFIRRSFPSSIQRPSSGAGQGASPPVISRFFGKISSPIESDKKNPTPMPSSVATSDADTSFESQDPYDVDVSKSLPFEPLEKTAMGAISDVQQPNTESQIRLPSNKQKPASEAGTLPAKENAFARMMRAGALQQKASKRKTTRSIRLPAKRLRSFVHQSKSETALVQTATRSGPSIPEPDAEMSPDASPDNVEADVSVQTNASAEVASKSGQAASSDRSFGRFRFRA